MRSAICIKAPASAHGADASVADEKTATGDGRERHGDLQLRVVAPAGALEGVGPLVIEDVLAIGMRSSVHRRDADRPPCIFEHGVNRAPAGCGADRLAVFERLRGTHAR